MERTSSERKTGEELASALLDACPAAICAKDTAGRYLVVNREWESVFHASRAQVAGKTDHEVFPPAVAAAIAERDRAVLETGAPVSAEQHVERKDGRHTYASVRFPVRDASGAICAIGCVSWESVSPGREDYYRAMVENSLEITAIMAVNGSIRYISPAVRTVLGYEPEEMIGRSVFDLLDPEDADAARAALARNLEEPDSVTGMEVRARHRDGSWRILDGVGRNMLDDPAVGGFILSVRDVTERKRAESALSEHEAVLQRTSEQMRALAARLLRAEEEGRKMVSRELHDDVNQRLAVLAFEAESLARDLPETREAIRGELMRLHRQLVQASDDVRLLAHELRPSILDDLGLGAALRAHCADFSRREKISVRFSQKGMPAGMPPDAALCLYRVAQEALRNVAKHSGAREASVTLAKADDAVELSIKDAGAGFEPGAAGTAGLGILSMAERARLAGGTLDVLSRPGAGTEVRVRVPLRAGAS